MAATAPGIATKFKARSGKKGGGGHFPKWFLFIISQGRSTQWQISQQTSPPVSLATLVTWPTLPAREDEKVSPQQRLLGWPGPAQINCCLLGTGSLLL